MGNSIIERCISCDSPTGGAGRGEDSIYLFNKYSKQEIEPLCEECACHLEETGEWTPGEDEKS